jgi:hypothetical protein
MSHGTYETVITIDTKDAESDSRPSNTKPGSMPMRSRP